MKLLKVCSFEGLDCITGYIRIERIIIVIATLAILPYIIATLACYKNEKEKPP
jgi:phage shock protein PspC (stress-responsive transcriptional regulator)